MAMRPSNFPHYNDCNGAVTVVERLVMARVQLRRRSNHLQPQENLGAGPGLLGDFAELAEQLASLVTVSGSVLEGLADELEARAREVVGILLELALGGHDLD